MTITYRRNGGRRVELFVPFRWEGKMVKHLDIGPCLLDHFLRWQKGEFATAIELLAEMVGEPETYVRHLAYPDTDRVLAAFVDMLPAPIQADIGNGLVPALTVKQEITPPSPPLSSEVEQDMEPPPKPEPGWPYQGEPPGQAEEFTDDLDLVGE